MFDKQYKFFGRHARRVDQLTSNFNSDSNAKFFNRNIDIYVYAPLIGFLYRRTAEQDNEKSTDTNQTYTKNVMGDRVIYSQDDLMFSFRIIMLLDEEYEPDLEKRINKAFRNIGENENDENRFNEYVRGGIDVLHEKLIQNENATTPEQFIYNLYYFIKDFHEKFNLEITAEEILKLCK